jgi:hypothetical protein
MAGWKRILFAGLLAAWGGPVTAAQSGFSWSTATPESQGMSSSRLSALRTDLQARGTTHFLVVRNDRIVHEWYASGQGRTTKHYTASAAKALVGGTSLAVAIHDGRLGLDDLASKHVPAWAGVNLKKDARVRHLGSHTSGIEDAESGSTPHDQLTGWKGDFWKRLAVPNDPFTVSRDKAPFLFAPGGRESYSNPGIAMLTYCVTASLRSAPVKDVRTLLRDRVMRPLGVPDAEWNCGYGQTFTVDGLPLVPSWGGGNYSPDAAARLARLLVRKGDWQGQRLLSAAAVDAVTRDAGTPGNGGQGWWTNSDGSAGGLPVDAFFGAGAGHQIVLGIPSLNLLCVRFGENLDAALSFSEAVRRRLFDPLMAAVTSTPSNPPPSVTLTAPAANATFAVGSSISLQATASDSNGSVSRVEFLANGTLLGGDTTSPYAFTWANVPAGSYTLTARATDNAGATATSAGVPVTVGGGTAFSVRIQSVSTGKPYALGTAQPGALYYIDRSYTIGSLASTLNGAVLVRTANDDKSVAVSSHLTLNVSGAATVYVPYDKRATTAPSWLGTWTVTTLSFAVSDAGASPMRVYSKSFPAGNVVLGGNLAGGGAGAGSNYVVLVKPAASSAVALEEKPALAAASLDPDAWEHAGDADGDGLLDDFEAAHGTSPTDPDTDGDGVPDEAELAPDGRSLWEVQEAGDPGPGPASACGATGAEVLLLFAMLALRRRRFRGRLHLWTNAAGSPR